MNQERHPEMECSQFETLLADALDGTLTSETRGAFDAHRLSCTLCGPLFLETQEGMLLLEALPEPDPPKNLVHNILATTSLAERRRTVIAPEPTGWLEKLRRRLPAPVGGLLHSRFATSFAMAFFSLTLTLNLLGVKVSQVDWHPSALRKSVVLEYTQIEARVQRYYDNMRIVYEVESRVQGLKKTTAPEPANNNNKNEKQEQNRNATPDTSGRPQEHENYSLERDSNLLAQSTTKHEGARI
jgi:hypothetical protein